MKPQGPIVTTVIDSNRENNCDIFDLVRKISDLVYRGFMWLGTMKSENLVGNL